MIKAVNNDKPNPQERGSEIASVEFSALSRDPG
jgi:hypothetical protein